MQPQSVMTPFSADEQFGEDEKKPVWSKRQADFFRTNEEIEAIHIARENADYLRNLNTLEAFHIAWRREETRQYIDNLKSLNMSNAMPDSRKDEFDQNNLLTNRPSILDRLKSEKKLEDGQLPKRRGPKPDSKPAAGPKQARNREAQRTHRERKERYTSELEGTIIRLQEQLIKVYEQRDSAALENRHLRELLASNGISYPHAPPSAQYMGDSKAVGMSMGGSVSGSYVTTEGTNFNSPSTLNFNSPTGLTFNSPSAPSLGTSYSQQPSVSPTAAGLHGTPQGPSPSHEMIEVGMELVVTYDSQGNALTHRPAPYPSPPPQ